MNKKLQNMLEEQLTKYMHLHKDMEVLSQEIVRLSKECVGSPNRPRTRRSQLKTCRLHPLPSFSGSQDTIPLGCGGKMGVGANIK